MGRPNVASKEWIVRQYDHEVQGMSVIKPMCGVERDAPSDGVVLKPLAESRKGVALGCGANPRYGALDPRAMAEAVIDEALRNVVAAGGDPNHTAILDNFSWGNCEKPDRLGALVKAARGCYTAGKAFEAPFVSGKDSLNNEYRVGDETLAIPPTLYVTAMSRVPNVANAVTMDAKKEGNLLLLVGVTSPELGGSEYLDLIGEDGGAVPRPDLERAPKVLEKLHAAMKLKQVRSCHDLSEGGLAVAVAEMCMAGGIGAEIDLGAIDHEPFPHAYDEDATLLFSESCTRFLVDRAGQEVQLPDEDDGRRRHPGRSPLEARSPERQGRGRPTDHRRHRERAPRGLPLGVPGLRHPPVRRADRVAPPARSPLRGRRRGEGQATAAARNTPPPPHGGVRERAAEAPPGAHADRRALAREGRLTAPTSVAGRSACVHAAGERRVASSGVRARRTKTRMSSAADPPCHGHLPVPGRVPATSLEMRGHDLVS